MAELKGGTYVGGDIIVANNIIAGGTLSTNNDTYVNGVLYTNGKPNTGDQDLSNLSTYTYVDGTFLKLAGGTMTGQLFINGITTGDYNNGIRINKDSANWSSLMLGGPIGQTSGHNGTSNWFIATNPSSVFMINPKNSSTGSGLDLYRDGDAKWRGNTIHHSGNFTNLNQLTTRNFSDLQNKPTTLSGYGITDALLASSYTASDVLVKIKTVDGSGSGLDADTLDGKHDGEITAAYFAPKKLSSGDTLDNISDGVWFYVNGNNPTNSVGDNSALLQIGSRWWDRFQLAFPGNNSNSLRFRSSTYESESSRYWNSWKTIAFTDSNVASATKLATSRTIWGQNFDGSGNVSGNLTGVGTISANGKLTISSGGISVAGVNRTGNIFTDTTGGTVLSGVNTGDQDLSNLSTYTYVDNTFLKKSGGTMTGNLTAPNYLRSDGATIWHSGNDGDGSGLDADLLDGKDSTFFRKRYNATIQTGTWSRILYATPINLSGSFMLSIQHTRGSVVVVGNVFLVTFGHNIHGQITALGTHGYTQIAVRLTGDDNNIYFEVKDSAGVLGTTQITQITLDNINANITTYTDFNDGTTLIGSVKSEVSTENNRINVDGNVVAYLTDNVASATKLQTTRTIWGQNFDGSGNVSGALTGVSTISASGTVTAPTFSGALSGNASTATKLATVRTLWGQNFDGSGNVSGALTGVSTISASGKLTISAGGISVAGVNRTGNIFTDTTGGTVLAGVNTGDQDLSNLSTYTYVDNTFLKLAGGTMTGNLTAPNYLRSDGATIWHSGNDGAGSGLDADTLDGIQFKDLYIPSSLSTSSAVGTVADRKADLITYFNSYGKGFGTNAIVSNSVISQWNQDSSALFASSVWNVIKIGGGYDGTTYGQWLLSSYGDSKLGVVGRSGDAWTPLRWIAFETSNVASATKLQTTRTIWGQNFDGSGNVSGALTGVSTITASGTVTAPTFSGALSGNASTATQLQNTRTIWGQNFNGTGNVSGALTGVSTISASGTVTAPTFSGALSGNASTATQLQNTRTIWGQNFNGTGNVSGTLTGVSTISASGIITGSAIQTSNNGDYSFIVRNDTSPALYVQSSATGTTQIASFRYGSATAGNGTEVMKVDNTGVSVTGKLTSTGTIRSNNVEFLRSEIGDYGVIHKNDGNNYYILFTDYDNNTGNYNSLRPFYINLENGNVTLGEGMTTTTGTFTSTASDSINTSGGVLASGEIKTGDRFSYGSAAYSKYNSITESIDFIFN